MATQEIDSAATRALVRKVTRRILPFVIVCYLFNYIDRINISLAKLPMSRDPALPDFNQGVFALGAALFFIGYCTFEVPSNLLQQRFGARRWIARIMITWGIISTCFMFTQGPKSFYFLRILLGFAEAGFFPGMVLYLSFWIPQRFRAKAAAILLTSTAIAGVIGNPIGGAILYFADHLPLLKPWQYLFLCEGLPTVVLGFVTLYVLTDTPKDAKWLSDDERSRLLALLEADRSEHPAPHMAHFKDAFKSPQVWMLAALYSLHSFGFYLVNYWTPTHIRNTLDKTGFITDKTPGPLSDLYVAMLSAIPFGAAAVGMVLIGRSSDKHRERRWHLAFALVLDMAGLTLAALAPKLAGPNSAMFLTIAGLSIAAVGAFGAFGPFWSLPNSLLVGTAAATGVALINSVGNFFGGYVGPQVIQPSLQRGLIIAAILALVAMMLTLLMPMRLQRAPEVAGAGAGALEKSGQEARD
jgi:MFS family permease